MPTPYLHLDEDGDERVNANLRILDQVIQQIENPAAQSEEPVTDQQIPNLTVTGNASISGLLSIDHLDAPLSCFPPAVQTSPVGDALTAETAVTPDITALASVTVDEEPGSLARIRAEATFLLRGTGLLAVMLYRGTDCVTLRRIPFSLHGTTAFPYSTQLEYFDVALDPETVVWRIAAQLVTGDRITACYAQVSGLVIR